MLIVSEIAEATEEARKGTPPVYVIQNDMVIPIESVSFESFEMREGDKVRMQKPEGELIELADAIIRICDYAGSRGWDLEIAVAAKMAYNATRSHMHGG